LSYALTIFLGAFLLFQVQPLIGKYILPWFGGGPGVWTTCMLFFQVVLLGGYAYAHLISKKFRPRAQAMVHLGLLVVALSLLPITPADSWKPQGLENPTLHILLLLAVCLGLPYLVLAATGPLIQHWFSRTHPGVSPYRLYALSNLGSLLALLTYPFYFETHFTRRAQAQMWAWGLGCYAVACAFCALKIFRSPKVTPASARAEDAAETAETSSSSTTSALSEQSLIEPKAEEGGSTLNYVLWFLLPACASVLLLAVTNKICQDVAVIPFLWILPLALYLVSFIICFDSPRWYVRFPFTIALGAALTGICWALLKGSDASIYKQVAVYAGALFICCMFCHGELYRLRPAPRRLTGFYLMIAAGGAAGGLFVAVIAPLLFTNYFELQCGILLCALLALMVWARQPAAEMWRIARSSFRHSPQASMRWPSLMVAILAIGCLALAASLWTQIREPNSEKVFSTRNFYGVLTVYEHNRNEAKDHHFLLQHGLITHGLQFVDPERSAWATTYYGEESGVGLAMRALPERDRRIGLVGLGTGTLAAYGKAGDYLHIYEINPEVKQLATSRFSFLTRCAAKVEVALGDARLSMEHEPPQGFDLLVLDAFSSDAIPVHLLTQESFQIYQRHLNTNAIIAVHISNHYLDLEPVVASLAQHFRYKMAMIDYDETDEEWWLYGSTWILLTRSDTIINSPAIQKASSTIKAGGRSSPLWTDDFTSLYQILK
jgi:spermidine synthase